MKDATTVDERLLAFCAWVRTQVDGVPAPARRVALQDLRGKVQAAAEKIEKTRGKKVELSELQKMIAVTWPGAGASQGIDEVFAAVADELEPTEDGGQGNDGAELLNYLHGKKLDNPRTVIAMPQKIRMLLAILAPSLNMTMSSILTIAVAEWFARKYTGDREIVDKPFECMNMVHDFVTKNLSVANSSDAESA